ncbi:glycosyltransferase [Bacillus cereus]|uniref:glycosyltransferase n=1 Tax=Bacillus cereus TaxID=1396 RepID=UPI003980E221
MKPKVSIIIPVYNVENLLGRCLNSLMSQTLEDIEIIMINDGSTDRSAEILNEYAKKDKRIIVIEKENGGVSSARNKGIQIASGEYIGFVDPDDWIDVEMYDTMYKEAVQSGADIVMCTYIREFGSHSKEKKFNLPQKVCYKGEEIKENVMRRLIGPINEEMGNPEFLDAWGTVWSKLYRSAVIKENAIQFVDLSYIGTNEDSLFNIQAFYYIDNFVFLNEPFYHYWKTNVASVTSNYKSELMNQWFNLYDIIERFLKDKGLSGNFQLALNNRICLNTLGLGLNTISKSNRVSPLTKFNILSKILNDNRIKRSFKQLEMNYFPIVWKAFYFCVKYRFTAGYYVMLVAIDSLRKMIR